MIGQRESAGGRAASSLLCCYLLDASLGLGCCSAAAAAPARPNVLVLFADDLGFNQLSIPGQPFGYSGVGGNIKTPNLAKLAAEGTTFMQWYSGFHVCTPSRASMMTGRLPVRVGLGDGVLHASAVGGLQHNETTMAEAVGAVGYATAMFGKWVRDPSLYDIHPSLYDTQAV
jgi:arylsulfatase A-like enzyme